MLPALLALLLLATGCRFSKSQSFPTTEPSDASDGPTYVALGDSYTTGGEIGDTAGYCLRSDVDYPALVAAKLKIGYFQDASCGGATTADLTQEQSGRGGSNAPQVEQLSAATTLVTLGIGLNDDGFATEIGYTCLKSGGKVTPACKSYLATPESAQTAKVRQIAADVRAAIKTIEKSAPNAKIVLVGYPRMLPENRTCANRYDLDARAADRLRQILAEVNVAWRGVADATGATYVDTYKASEGHDICSADPWVNGFVPVKGDGASLHPNAAYHRAVAQLVEAAVG